ncbi:hypothetical protein SBADM41S_00344 [Streptomyces badius]
MTPRAHRGPGRGPGLQDQGVGTARGEVGGGREARPGRGADDDDGKLLFVHGGWSPRNGAADGGMRSARTGDDRP